MKQQESMPLINNKQDKKDTDARIWITCPHCGWMTDLYCIEDDPLGVQGKSYYTFNQKISCKCGHKLNIMLAVQDINYGGKNDS
jgi:hypothetical protein